MGRWHVTCDLSCTHRDTRRSYKSDDLRTRFLPAATCCRTMHGPDGFGLPPAGPPGVGRVGSGTSSRPGSSVSSSSNGTAASGMSSSNSGSNSGSMSNSNKDTSGPPHPPMTDPVAPAPPPSSESSGGSGGGSYGGGPGGLFAGLRGMGGAAVAAAAAGERSGAGGGGKEEHKVKLVGGTLRRVGVRTRNTCRGQGSAAMEGRALTLG